MIGSQRRAHNRCTLSFLTDNIDRLLADSSGPCRSPASSACRSLESICVRDLGEVT